ncbi:uncharacterized protein V6R79_000587 [Siganus canaliculatus]
MHEQEVPSPESGVIVKTAQDGCAEGLVYGGGGREGIFIKDVVPESPASKSLQLKQGDQILSATVYFDNVPYEDAIQILEHAQAYKVKLCLKRKPDITDTEPAIESDIIPEEEIHTPEMREQGKTKRRGDARISWPKFPSFGKGRKSRFTRSHSSSEADEQRKLELSPTTSDTDSPIKSQDALKGKKRHKIKLSGLKKRGRVSSSEDTDAPTSGQTGGKSVQTQETSEIPLESPECLESPSGETPQRYVVEGQKVVEDFRLEQEDQKLTETQHKVELIAVDTTLKTADLTVALADKEVPSDTKSPEGKKKKKEKSELKMKILGKDKSHKKAKASPKRLKTLGASIETPDQPETEKTKSKLQVDQPALEVDTQLISTDGSPQIKMSVPKVELDIPDSEIIRKSPKKVEEKTKKDAKVGRTFKLPKIGISNITTEEAIQKTSISVEETTAKTELKDKDPYEQLSKSGLPRTQLPKREEIEIPGMEDISVKTKVVGIKEPKVDYIGHHEDIQAEAVQLSIDVDSVKEAVSKLPGYNLPKVDVSGVPIPEEITVIDANAQRISVKTPTKVVDAKKKVEAHTHKITATELATEEVLTETMVEFKTDEKKSKSKAKKSEKDIKTEVYRREDIIIPGKESAQEATAIQAPDSDVTASFGIAKPDFKIPNIAADFPEQNIQLIKEVKMTKSETRKMQVTIGDISDVKVPEIDSIDYIDSADLSPSKQIAATALSTNIATTEITREIEVADTEDTIKLPATDKDMSIDGKGGKFKMPALDISMPKRKGPKIELSRSQKPEAVLQAEGKAEVKVPDVPGAVLADADISFTEQMIEVEGKPQLEIKQRQSEREHYGQGGKFKMPKFGIEMPKFKGPELDLSSSKKGIAVTAPDATAEEKLTEDIHIRTPQIKTGVKIPDVEASAKLEMKPSQVKGMQRDAEGSPLRFKIPALKLPKFGINTTAVSTEVSNKTKTTLSPETQLKPSKDSTAIDIKAPSFEIESPAVQTSADIDGKGSKFKMPRFGISMPKLKEPETDLGLLKRDVDVTLPEAKTEIKPPEVEVKAPVISARQQNVEESPSKFKMPSFKLPKFGIGTPNVSLEVRDIDKDVKIDRADVISAEGSTVHITAPSIDTEGPSIDMGTSEAELDVKGGRLKMPNLGFSMPKVKGPVVALTLSQKDGTSSEGNTDREPLETQVQQATTDIPGGSEIGLEIHPPEFETDVDVHGQKVKKSTFGMKMPKIEGPRFGLSFENKDTDTKLPEKKLPEVDLGKVHVSIPEGKMEVENAEVEKQSLQFETEVDGQGKRLKMPKFGITMPKVKGPALDLSISSKEVDLTLPQTKVDVSLPDAPKMDKDVGKVDVLIPDAKVELEKTQLEIKSMWTDFEEQESKLKFPKFKGPKFDVAISKKDVNVQEAKAEVNLAHAELKAPSGKAEMKAPEIKIVAKDSQPSKFKMPNVSATIPKLKGPEIDLSLPRKDLQVKLQENEAADKLLEGPKIDVNLENVDVSIADVKTEVKKPEIELKPQFEYQLDGQGTKFKMPKFGISMPHVKAPEVDFSLSKDDDIKLQEAKAEINVPDVKLEEMSPKVEIKAAGTEAPLHTVKGSPSKFKMPTFKFPRFGSTTPKVTMEVPDTEKSIKTGGADMSISVPHGDVDIPEVKSEVSLPDFEIKEPADAVVIDEQTSIEVDAKMKKPRFIMPRFSFSKPSAKVPEADVSVPDVNIAIPERKVDMTEADGQEMPKFGITMPKLTGPEIDLSPSKKAADVMLTEVKTDVKLPDIKLKEQSVEADISITDVKLKSGFHVDTPSGSIEMPKMDKDNKTVTTETEQKGSKFKMPSLSFSVPQVKMPEIDVGLSKKDTDITLQGIDAQVKIPDAEYKETSVELEIKTPEIKDVTKRTEESPSKFKMPAFNLPKFGVHSSSATAEVSHMDQDVKIPEEVLTVDIAVPSIESEGPSIHIKNTEIEEKGSKFKMPSLGISVPQVKTPEVNLRLSNKDIGVTLPETKPEIKFHGEVKEPHFEVEMAAPDTKTGAKKKDSPSKFKMPTFKIPKFGIDMYKDVRIDGADMKTPEEVLTVHIATTSKNTEDTSIHMKTTEIEHEEKQSKFKMPSFAISVPQIQQPTKDLGFPHKDADVSLPEVQVKPLDVELKKPSVEAEIKVPEFDGQAHPNIDGSSTFKMPTFKLPKFGGTPQISGEVSKDKGTKLEDANLQLPEVKAEVKLPDFEMTDPDGSASEMAITGDAKMKKTRFSLPRFSFSKQSTKEPVDDVTLPDLDGSLTKGNVEVAQQSLEVAGFGIGTPKLSIEASDVDKEIKIERAKLEVAREGTVDVTAPSIATEGLSVDVKDKGGEFDGSGSKFKMPKMGISMPKVSGPESDLSLPSKDVTIPEAEVGGKLLDIQVKDTNDISLPDAPTFEGEAKLKRPSWTFPKFSFSKTTQKTPDIDVNLETPKVDVSSPEVTAEVSLPTVEIQGSPVKMVTEAAAAPELDASLKKPRFSMPRLSFSKASVKEPEVSAELPHAELSIPEVKVEVKPSAVELKAPEDGVKLDEAGSKFKMPKFGISVPTVKGPEIDMSLSKIDETPKGEVTLPEVKVEVSPPNVVIQGSPVKMAKETAAAPEVDLSLKKPRFSLPRLSFSKASVKEPEVSAELPHAELSIPEGKVEVAPSAVELKAPEDGVKLDEAGSKFKMPKFGFSVPTLKGPEIDMSLSKIDETPKGSVTSPEVKAEVSQPIVEIKGSPVKMAKETAAAPEVDASLKKPRFSLPRLSFSKASVKEPEVSAELPHAELSIPEGKVEVAPSAVELKAPEDGVKLDDPGSKFKMPKFGISVPTLKGPEIDMSLSKIDERPKGEVTLPEVKVEVSTPNVVIQGSPVKMAKETAAAPEVDLSLKKPRFSLPRLSFSKASVKEPEVSAELPHAELSIPEGKVEVAPSAVELKAPEDGVKLDEAGSKFKMPKFGFSVPTVKGPEIDMSLSKIDETPKGSVTLPEVKAEVGLPTVEIKGSPVKMAKETAAAPEVDLSLKKPRFSLPRLSFSKASVKEPEVSAEIPHAELSIPEKTVDVKPSAMAGMPPEGGAELDGSGGKFKMPKFGISMPKVKGPEIDLSLSKQGADVTLPEVKGKGHIPEVKIKEQSAKIEGIAPEIEGQTGNVEGSPSKFKMPTFTLPKFGIVSPKASMETSELEVSKKATVEATIPSIGTEDLSVDVKVKGTELDGSESRFKMPKFGISMPRVKGPEIDISLSKKDETPKLTSAEVKAEVSLPEVEIQGSPVKLVKETAAAPEVDASLKKPRFSLPRLSFSKASVKEPEVSAELPHAELSIPDVKVEVKPSAVELKAPDDGVKLDETGSKFKMPKFGFSVPTVKGPEIDLSLSKIDERPKGDVTLPEVKAEVSTPNVEIQGSPVKMAKETAAAPEVDLSLKKPRFSLPRLSFSKASVKEPEISAEIPHAELSIPEKTVDVKPSAMEGMPPEGGIELDMSGGKFKMPKFGISMPKVKGPEIDLSLSKQEADVTLPEVKGRVQIPDVKIKEQSGKVEGEAPQIEVRTENVEGSPSKFKMPTFALPKFGIVSPKASMEVSELDKDRKTDGVKLGVSKKSTVDVTIPRIGTEDLSVDMKVKGTELDGSESRFKMPKFGISMPKVKGPEMDISLSKTDVTPKLTSPEVKAEVNLPEVAIQGSPVKISKATAAAPEVDASLKKPRFSLPRLSFSKASVKEPEVSAELPHAELSIPEGKVEVKPSTVELKAPEDGFKLDEAGGKFKMPKFGFSVPTVKGPEIDISLSKIDETPKGGVTLPEVKAEVSTPNVEIQGSPVKMIKETPAAPEVDASLKKPRFSLPRLSFSKASVKEPEVSAELPHAELSIPDVKVEIKPPHVELKAQEDDLKLDEPGSKFKMPKFGFSVPTVKGPEIDMSLSKIDEVPKVDVTSPEVKAEVSLPNVKVQGSPVKLVKETAAAPEVDASLKKPRFSLPRLSFSKASVKEPEVSAELPHAELSTPEAKVEVGVKAPEVNLNLTKNDGKVTIVEAEAKLPEVQIDGGDISLPDEPTFDGEAKLKRPSWTFPKFSFSKAAEKTPDTDVNLETHKDDVTSLEVKAEASLPEAKVQGSLGGISMEGPPIPELETSPKKKFSLPRLSFSKPSVTETDVTPELPHTAASFSEGQVNVKQTKMAETDAKLRESVTVAIKGPSIDIKGDVSKTEVTEIETPKAETDTVILDSPSKFKLPSFKMPRLSFSKAVPEDENVAEYKEEKQEIEIEKQEDTKSPKMTLTSFGEMLKTIDVEFDVPNLDKEEQNLETNAQQVVQQKKESSTQDTVKSPEKTSWFKFPTFGLSSPTKPAVVLKSPAGETADEEMSPTSSIHSSDAFADVSSAMTSEHVGLSLSSPTKVTVKYSDPNASTGLREMHSNIITSTTRTELISVEPNLPEKITILSSGASSSSEDTLRLDSGKIHVVTSNIQATPSAQQAKILTAVQTQPAGGLTLKSEASKAASWTVHDSQSSKRTIFERHLVTETSSEVKGNKETIVITKQVTRTVDSSEPISGETASSLQQLRDTVHTEKMRFFDRAKK